MKTQNFFFVLQQDEKHLSLFFYQAQNLHNLQSFLFYLQNKRIVTRMTAQAV